MREWNKIKDDDDLLYEKELLPVGQFINWVSDDERVPIHVTQPYLDKMLADFKKFKEVGVRVPLFKSHIEDVDNERGLIEDVILKPNAQGVGSSFVHVRFADKASRDAGIRNDVSAMCPPRFVDGKGNQYEYPLRHVALTSTPVIPGLSKFAPVVLSFGTPSGLAAPQSAAATPITGITPMSDLIQAILDAMGITAPDGLDDQAKLQLVLKKLAGAAADPAGAATAAATAPAAGAMALSHSPVMVKQFAALRTNAIDGLVREAVITPTHADKLKKQFCSNEAVTVDLALSADDNASGETEFDRTVQNLRDAAASRPAAKSGRVTQLAPDGKAVVLGHNNSGTQDNALIRNMKKRAGIKSE